MKNTNQAGFTLLEILVATTIMGIAVGGLLTSLSTSTRNASRVVEADRATLMARNKLDELLVDPNLPLQGELQGVFETRNGNQASGWVAHIAPFEGPPVTVPGVQVLQRIALTVWWQSGSTRREFPAEAYRIVEIPRPTE